MNNTWLTINQVSEILGCSVQNVHYLVKGRYRKSARRKKFSEPVFRKVKYIKRGNILTTYLIHMSEVVHYINKHEGETA